MEERHKTSRTAPESIGLILIAALLLNLGLFPVLFILSPVVTGAIVGFIVKRPAYSLVVSFLPAFTSYLIFFWIIAMTPDVYFQLADVFQAALLMGAAGAIGSLLGMLIARIVPRNVRG